MKSIFKGTIIVLMLVLPIQAHARDSFDTSDKVSHVKYSAIGVLGSDIFYTNLGVKHADEYAALTLLIAGHIREEYINDIYSGKDMVANFFGVASMYAGVKLSKSFGFNPLYFEW